MKKTWILILSMVVGFGLAADLALAQPKVLKISNGVNEQHPSYLAGKKFGEILAAKLPGKNDVQVYANAQLGDDVRATCSNGTTTWGVSPPPTSRCSRNI